MLLRELSRRLRRVDEKVGSLVLLDVNGRVAQLLLDLADEAGADRITSRLTHHTIAQMIGSSRETVSRTMRELVEKGSIDRQPPRDRDPRPRRTRIVRRTLVRCVTTGE